MENIKKRKIMYMSKEYFEFYNRILVKFIYIVADTPGKFEYITELLFRTVGENLQWLSGNDTSS